QHTPSTQNPLEHSFGFAATHGPPSAFLGRHVPVPRSQYWLPWHDASFTQAPAHALPEHTKGAHEAVPLSTQVPAPSQVLASVLVEPAQVWGAHSVAAS